jgi:hypothetical protein
MLLYCPAGSHYARTGPQEHPQVLCMVRTAHGHVALMVAAANVLAAPASFLSNRNGRGI